MVSSHLSILSHLYLFLISFYFLYRYYRRFVPRRTQNIFCFTKNCNSKKIPRKSFAQNFFLLNANLKNVLKQKRCTRVILLGAEKISTRKNQNSETKNNVFSISYFEKCFYMQSLPTANFSLV